MTKTEAARRTALENALMTLGFTRDESDALRRISLTLRRWFELECGIDGGHVERDAKTDKPYFVASASGRRWPQADRERGAMRRLRKIMHAVNERRFVGDSASCLDPHCDDLAYYIQPDPRGAALYILRPGDVPANERAESCYTRGLCVY
jgi:hypothetical protein